LARGRNTILSLSRRYAASESGKRTTALSSKDNAVVYHFSLIRFFGDNENQRGFISMVPWTSINFFAVYVLNFL